MSEPAEATNPYRSPTAALETPAAGAAPPTIRWRIVPTFLTILFGVASLFAGVVESAVAAFGVVVGRVEGPGQDVPAGWFALDGALCLLAGVWFMMASRAWWNSRYKRGIVVAVLAFAPYLASVLIKMNVIFAG